MGAGERGGGGRGDGEVLGIRALIRQSHHAYAALLSSLTRAATVSHAPRHPQRRAPAAVTGRRAKMLEIRGVALRVRQGLGVSGFWAWVRSLSR